MDTKQYKSKVPVEEVIKLREQGKQTKEIAKIYGVTSATIINIVKSQNIPNGVVVCKNSRYKLYVDNHINTYHVTVVEIETLNIVYIADLPRKRNKAYSHNMLNWQNWFNDNYEDENTVNEMYLAVGNKKVLFCFLSQGLCLKEQSSRNNTVNEFIKCFRGYAYGGVHCYVYGDKTRKCWQCNYLNEVSAISFTHLDFTKSKLTDIFDLDNVDRYLKRLGCDKKISNINYTARFALRDYATQYSNDSFDKYITGLLKGYPLEMIAYNIFEEKAKEAESNAKRLERLAKRNV